MDELHDRDAGHVSDFVEREPVGVASQLHGEFLGEAFDRRAQLVRSFQQIRVQARAA